MYAFSEIFRSIYEKKPDSWQEHSGMPVCIPADTDLLFICLYHTFCTRGVMGETGVFVSGSVINFLLRDFFFFFLFNIGVREAEDQLYH